MSTITPESLLSAGQQVVSICANFKQLQMLTRRLQGLPDSAPLPDGLEIKKIDITFETPDGPQTATLRTVKHVGDLARLLELETEALVEQLREEANRARTVVTALEQLCSQATYIVNAQRSGLPV